MGFRGRAALTAVLVSLTIAGPAQATFLGKNGKISFNRLFESDDGFSNNLFSVSPDGSNVFQVTDFGLFTLAEFSDHSPDGRTLAFQRFDITDEEQSPATQVWLTDADGDNPRQLTAFADTDAYEGGFDPAFSPDGRTLAVDTVADGVPGIFLIPARAHKGKLITEADAQRVTSVPDAGFDSEPQFSPDGRWIVFTRYSEGCLTGEDCQTRIFRVRTNGKDLRQLTSPELNASAPDWHPSGLAIAFDTHDNGLAPNAGHIMVMLPDGSHKQIIVRAGKDTYYNNPSFSPDGLRVSYAKWPLLPPGDDAESSEIWTAWVTGTGQRRHTSGARDNKPDWGPAVRRGH